MRRHTPGVVSGPEMLPSLIRRVERLDPQRVVDLLEPMVLDRRAQRLREVIGQRLSSVQIIFDAPHDPHNGAAVVRSCEAFGVQFVHVVERLERFLAAPRVSRGSEKWVDLHRWQSVGEVVTSLQADGLELVAAHPDGELLQDLVGSLDSEVEAARVQSQPVGL